MFNNVVLLHTDQHSAFNAACDAALLIIPLGVVRKLQMESRTKLGLCAVLGLSLFTLIATLFRAPFVHVLEHSDDFTWSLGKLLFCAVVEANVIVIAGSIPTLRPLITGRRTKGTSHSTGMRPHTAGGTATGRNAVPGHLDDASSEEIMVGSRFMEKDGGITKWTSVTVSDGYSLTE